MPSNISSPEYWSIDGVSLHQYAWSIKSVGGTRNAIVPKRGENVSVAYRPGKLHVPKTLDERVITLEMWMGAYKPDGTPSPTPTVQWNDSWDFLRRLVYKPNGGEVTLTRRWFQTVDGVAKLLIADAKAEITGTMEPRMNGRYSAEFSMELILADPYFYGPTISVDLPANTGQVWNSPTNTVSVVNPGVDVVSASHLTVDFHGGFNTTAVLRNFTPDPILWMQMKSSVSDGYSVHMDIGKFTAVVPEQSNKNVVSTMSHSGSHFWFGLAPGENKLRFDVGSAGVTPLATIKFRPPYW